MKIDGLKLKRRDYLKGSVALLGAAFLKSKNAQAVTAVGIDAADPIQKLAATEYQSFDFNGDNTDKPHEGLWNPDGVAARAGGWPTPSEKHSIVIVGGGLSGLLAAYNLQDRRPLVLELDKKMGGNSKGEELAGVEYSIGAAYITVPDQGSSIETFLEQTGLLKLARHESSEEVTFFMKKRLQTDFFSGVTDPLAQDQFKRLDVILKQNYEEAYPDIPWSSESALSEEQLHALDSISFEQWLEQVLGKTVHPHIKEYFQLYAWSSFTASISEVSAAQMLNFVLSEIDGVLAFPGGNAAITQRLYEILKKNIGRKNLRTECLVIRVQCVEDGAIIYYQDANNILKAVKADKVIMACQKFVAQRVCVDMPQEQYKAIEEMQYRGYIVGNAIYDQKISSPGFDLYCYEGECPEEPRAMRPPQRNFTDIVMGQWAQEDSGNISVVTAYRPLPFDGARQFLFSPMAHQKHLAIIEQGMAEFETQLGLDKKRRKGIRMTRWGHSLPVASVGFIASGASKVVSSPIQDKIFFANQDNWANPAFECAYAAVEDAVEKLKSVENVNI